jgi:excinuclease ABC subunit C
LMNEAPRLPSPLAGEGGVPQSGAPGEGPGIPVEAGILESSPDLALLGLPPPQRGREDEGDDSPWPDLVLIDGGLGQLNAARDVLAGLGAEVPLVAIAKGPDRDAGRETFFLPGRDSFKLPPRDPVLYFVERLRDEAHRFAVGSHRTRRARDMREAGLQEIAGIGPTRKRALLHHFGTLKAIERASVTDLMQVEGISAETARRIYEFFHEGAA